MKDFSLQVSKAIQSTERYYREQIFSSGCSSMVSIYRITENATSVQSIKKQLQGSPYIQKGINFSEQLVNTILDIELYVFEGKHFFMQGDLNSEIIEFIDHQCSKVSSFDEITGAVEANFIDWSAFDRSLSQLTDKYTILSGRELESIIEQLKGLSTQIALDSKVKNYLQLFQASDWSEKKEVNYISLIKMLLMANHMQLSDSLRRDLVAVGLLKDIGYTRLNDKIDNFELLHPLVSHQIVSAANELLPATKQDQKLNRETLIAIALHHEFIDGSGPLMRLKHPLALDIIEQRKLPLIAQISGICDLYTSLLTRYDSACAYAISLGFVSGQGDMALRYHQSVIDAFVESFRTPSFNDYRGDKKNSISLLDDLFACLLDETLRNKAKLMVQAKSANSFDQITLAINLLRNIAEKQPGYLSDANISSKLKLPEEFVF